jgi:hypothetical protein
MTKSTAKNNSG